MPLLRKPVLKPLEAGNFMDPSTMISDRGGFPTNMRLYRNYLKKREGKTSFGTYAISGSAIHIAQYPMENQVIQLVRFSQRKAERYNPTTKEWEDITGTNFTGDVDDFFSTCVAEDKLLITNYIDKIRTYNNVGNTADLVASSGTVPRAKYIAYNESGYLIVAYTDAAVGGSTKVQWSDIGDITAWGSGNYGSRLLRHSPNPIRGLKNLNEFTIAYKKDSIYVGRPVDTSDIILWDLAYTGVGLISGRAIADHCGRHFFQGIDGFYVFNGVRPDPIDQDSIKREVYGKLDRSKADRCFALLVEEVDEVWFFIVTTGNDWPTEIWKYNYRVGFWYYDTCSSLASAAIYYQQSALTVDELVGLVSEQNWRIDDALLGTDFPIVIVGDRDGYTFQGNPMTSNDNGVAIDGHWETMDFSADKLEGYKRWLQLDFEAKGNNIIVDYSTDFGKTWTNIPKAGSRVIPLADDWTWYRLYFDKVSQYMRFRFKNDRSNETFYLRAYYPFFLQREEVNR